LLIPSLIPSDKSDRVVGATDHTLTVNNEGRTGSHSVTR
jgi:hypothetical protein